MMSSSDEYLFDSDVLIDFREVDPKIIQWVSRTIGKAHITATTLGEVKALDRKECARLRIDVEVPSTTELMDAGKITETISFADKVCLVVSKERGWTCVTNDRKLRECCEKLGVKTRRGLALLIDLVIGGVLSKRQALRIAESIGENNPGHIGPDVLEEFRRKLS